MEESLPNFFKTRVCSIVNIAGLIAEWEGNENNISTVIICHRWHPLCCPRFFETMLLITPERLLQSRSFPFTFQKPNEVKNLCKKIFWKLINFFFYYLFD
ncbi:MAG: hypothetical protein A2W74_09225 [Planctomycetes bacterium RIFCSPLOWO2_12_38_17]|nr:MAG: hypothetical protein A2W74_09225 [Planctomycetes bacterium RIFCSPLOWO2_12_38_17]